MITNIFVDFDNRETYTEDEYSEKVLEFIEEALDDNCIYCSGFSSFLESHYDQKEIWDMDEDDKMRVIDEFKEEAEYEIHTNWDCEPFEIEV